MVCSNSEIAIFTKASTERDSINMSISKLSILDFNAPLANKTVSVLEFSISSLRSKLINSES